jgi:hypothetical protein
MDVDDVIASPDDLVDTQDARAQAARFSINTIDIFDTPKPIKLGQWNPRELKETEAVKLKKSMEADDIRPFRFENMFNLIIDKRFVDPACMNTKIDGGNQDAPLLKLSEEGLAKAEVLYFAGGRHRIRAVQILKNERNEKLKQMQEQFRKEKKDGGNEKAIEKMEQAIKEQAAFISRLGKWGVILYDAGQSCLN